MAILKYLGIAFYAALMRPAAAGLGALRGAGLWRRDAVLLPRKSRGRLAVRGPVLGRRLHARF